MDTRRRAAVSARRRRARPGAATHARGVDAVLVGDDLPELGADLVAALAGLKMNNLNEDQPMLVEKQDKREKQKEETNRELDKGLDISEEVTEEEEEAVNGEGN